MIHRQNMFRATYLPLVPFLVALAGCASTTTVQVTPSPQAPVCAQSASAKILWTTDWRSDQKDVADRERAAGQGLDRFFATSNCFKVSSLQYVSNGEVPSEMAKIAAGTIMFDKIVLISIRELGPVIKIGTSMALIEGGTEVVFETSEQEPGTSGARRFLTVWRSGGPGVIKGVDSLTQDIQSALNAALQP